MLAILFLWCAFFVRRRPDHPLEDRILQHLTLENQIGVVLIIEAAPCRGKGRWEHDGLLLLLLLLQQGAMSHTGGLFVLLLVSCFLLLVIILTLLRLFVKIVRRSTPVVLQILVPRGPRVGIGRGRDGEASKDPRGTTAFVVVGTHDDCGGPSSVTITMLQQQEPRLALRAGNMYLFVVRLEREHWMEVLPDEKEEAGTRCLGHPTQRGCPEVVGGENRVRRDHVGASARKSKWIFGVNTAGASARKWILCNWVSPGAIRKPSNVRGVFFLLSWQIGRAGWQCNLLATF